MTEKTVEFTCMPAGRQADLYLKKVNQGKLIPEFKNLETSFSSQVQSLQTSIIDFRLGYLESGISILNTTAFQEY